MAISLKKISSNHPGSMEHDNANSKSCIILIFYHDDRYLYQFFWTAARDDEDYTYIEAVISPWFKLPVLCMS